MKEISIEADVRNLSTLLSFIADELDNAECTKKGQMRIAIAAEELFVNIASYAYKDRKGTCTVRVDACKEEAKAILTFIDEGEAYNLLEKQNPDVTLSAEDRPIGGLGIYIVKKSMDEVSYKREEGRNIVTIVYSWE